MAFIRVGIADLTINSAVTLNLAYQVWAVLLKDRATKRRQSLDFVLGTLSLLRLFILPKSELKTV